MEGVSRRAERHGYMRPVPHRVELDATGEKKRLQVAAELLGVSQGRAPTHVFTLGRPSIRKAEDGICRVSRSSTPTRRSTTAARQRGAGDDSGGTDDRIAGRHRSRQPQQSAESSATARDTRARALSRDGEGKVRARPGSYEGVMRPGLVRTPTHYYFRVPPPRSHDRAMLASLFTLTTVTCRDAARSP